MKRLTLVFIAALLLSCNGTSSTRIEQNIGIVYGNNPDVDFVLEACGKLKDNYYDPSVIKYPALLNAALEGVAKELKKHNIDFVSDSIDASIADGLAARKFSEMFKRAQELAGDKAEFVNHHLAFIAVEAMLDSLDDSHSYFVSPEEYLEEQRQRRGEASYSGIGSLVRKIDDCVFLAHVFPDSPADKAGLKTYDRVLKVDNWDVANNDLLEVIKRVRGPAGSKVRLAIERKGKPIVFEVTRGDIVTPFATYKFLKYEDKTFCYFKLYGFQWGALPIVGDCLIEFIDKNASGLILDLRGNPGGFVIFLNFMLDIFLAEDLPTYVTKDKYGERKYRTSNDQIWDTPLVILIDGSSGSASEIFSAVLSEHNRAWLVGEKSSGSVSVGLKLALPFDAAMSVTVSQLVTAKGKVLEKVGVAPDVEVKVTKEYVLEGEDKQLDKALEVLFDEVSYAPAVRPGFCFLFARPSIIKNKLFEVFKAGKETRCLADTDGCF